MTLTQALFRMVSRPIDLLIRRWNWKAAFFSSLVRGFIFLFANLKSGWHAAAAAMVAEWLYRAPSSGVYGAATQMFGEIEPEWQGALAASVLMPLWSHSLEFCVHYLRHTPHLKASIIASVSFTIISTLFNFYAMRRGMMTVGSNSASITEDLRRLPRIIAGFIAVVPLWIWRAITSTSRRREVGGTQPSSEVAGC